MLRPIALAASLFLCVPAPQEPPPGPAAGVIDAAGTTVAITDAALSSEEAEGGTLYVTRLPYVPLQTGRGEWRIPLAAIARINVEPPATPAALPTPGAWRAQLRVTVPAEGRPSVVTTRSSGVLPLDAALGLAAVELPFQRPTGEGSVATQPLLLEASVQLRAVRQPAVPGLPVLRLQLRNGESATGRATGPLVLVGTRGAGTYRIALRECRSITLK